MTSSSNISTVAKNFVYTLVNSLYFFNFKISKD